MLFNYFNTSGLFFKVCLGQMYNVNVKSSLIKTLSCKTYIISYFSKSRLPNTQLVCCFILIENYCPTQCSKTILKNIIALIYTFQFLTKKKKEL